MIAELFLDVPEYAELAPGVLNGEFVNSVDTQ